VELGFQFFVWDKKVGRGLDGVFFDPQDGVLFCSQIKLKF
jgi:hypothetical protein